MATQLARHMDAIADSFDAEEVSTADRRIKMAETLLDDLFFNMGERYRKRGIKKPQKAEELHTLLFDETFDDVRYSVVGKDMKVRVYFEPLIRMVKGDKNLLLPIIKRMLDRYFPIPEEIGREWYPVWKTVEYKPKKKWEARTHRLTLQFNWKRKPRAAEHTDL